MMQPTSQTFYMHLTGPYRNIGDSLIRRNALRAAPPGTMRVVRVKPAAGDWIDSLDLHPENVLVYESTLRWSLDLILRRSRPILFREPGEFNLDRRFVGKEMFFVCLALVARLKRGSVGAAPRGLAKRSRLGVFLHTLFCLMADTIYWREPAAQQVFGRGELVPDIGFFGGDSVPTSHREILAVSLRGDRPLPSQEWALGVREFARRHELRIVVCTQVEEDHERTLALAQMLSGTPFQWEPSTSSLAQEESARALYRESAIVISDRLHAAIIGATEGAVPIELVSAPTGKVARHFDCIGVSDVSVDALDLSASEIVNVIERIYARRDSIMDAVQATEHTLMKTVFKMNGRLIAAQ